MSDDNGLDTEGDEGDDTASNNGADESHDVNIGGDSYPSKLPFWVSANLVARHPSSKDKETCLACLEEMNAEKNDIMEIEGMDDEERKLSLMDVEQRSESPQSFSDFAICVFVRLLTTSSHLSLAVKDAYWLTNGNGRFRHMSECTHQTQDTREKAKVRLDRYLAMARQRMKARHQREKLEKKKRLGPGGVASRGNGGRQSSADRGTPEP